ncbi:type II 3-dehydroquinate dehydratase [Candidatus Pantoea edessiphila]|uniref:3-dehydroquinate dehydratase n=1 Tax=Candidatus Pantoea edessiphila TaxID=2044610 RepID=A0A2P5SXT5_9GAMM|nr:type II 3-dehydroquinate dehydratase [Candidatus Pantoea edessiphila]MBK4775933.1 type II 3-dehydroquinate dehydratase [Pantoea sp. Edef]PPI87113.1 type II 3-dehydroquinate dehydratase [Candidatus Pantoea edessiphila]
MEYKSHILLLNGPNLNLLGRREPEKYGYISLNNILNDLIQYANNLNIKLSHLQSNSEVKLIDRIHEAIGDVNYIIINPAAFAHTSIALRDALLASSIPFIEIHVSNIYSRESFRQISYLADISEGLICGFGTESYIWALKIAIQKLSKIN